MGHPKPDEIFPIGSTVFWKKRNCFAIIVDHAYRYPGEGGFMHYYLNEVKGREGQYAGYHDDLVLMEPPPGHIG